MIKPRWKTWMIIGTLALGAGAWLAMPGGSKTGEEVPTFVAQRGPLQVDVLQGGDPGTEEF